MRLTSPAWRDYALLDSGNGQKLERFGDFSLIRPEAQARWKPVLPPDTWGTAGAIFQQEAWQFRQKLPARWAISYRDVQFWIKPTPFRHVGVFPEQAAHWDWMCGLISEAAYPIRVLNLFAYTGIVSLFAAAAGAHVTHVDSSKPAVAWARENQELAGLSDRPIRWIVEDAVKYVGRELKRGSRYEGLLLDPPPFGHGAQGELWKFEKSLPLLLDACRQLMSEAPLFVILTAYTTQTDLPSLSALIQKMMAGQGGNIEAGTTVLVEQSGGRELEPATFVRWSNKG